MSSLVQIHRRGASTDDRASSESQSGREGNSSSPPVGTHGSSERRGDYEPRFPSSGNNRDSSSRRMVNASGPRVISMDNMSFETHSASSRERYPPPLPQTNNSIETAEGIVSVAESRRPMTGRARSIPQVSGAISSSNRNRRPGTSSVNGTSVSDAIAITDQYLDSLRVRHAPSLHSFLATQVFTNPGRVSQKNINKQNHDLRSSMTTRNLTAAVDQTCCICLEDFAARDEVLNLQCSHMFHAKCIFQWINKEKNKCPLCNTEITCHGTD